eukprot:s1387_g7.t1
MLTRAVTLDMHSGIPDRECLTTSFLAFGSLPRFLPAWDGDMFLWYTASVSIRASRTGSANARRLKAAASTVCRQCGAPSGLSYVVQSQSGDPRLPVGGFSC